MLSQFHFKNFNPNEGTRSTANLVLSRLLEWIALRLSYRMDTHDTVTVAS